VSGRRLDDHRRVVDDGPGISEEFLERRLGPADAFALLTAPLGGPRELAWVVSPSPGPEHGNLRRLETLVARSLAAAGFPALRIRPDLHPVEGVTGEIDVTVQLATLRDAIEVVRDRTGASAVGLVGTMFGATAAALVADGGDVPLLALLEPVTRGRTYVREIVRRQAVADLMEAADGGPPPGREEPERSNGGTGALDELASTGSVSIRGLRLTHEQFERISAIALDSDLTAFAGRSLLVGISPTGTAPAGLRKLHDRLESLGGDVTLELLEDPLEAPFGEYYFRNAGPVRLDTRLELDRRLARLTTEWAATAYDHAAGSSDA
jgi:hypothetical protein